MKIFVVFLFLFVVLTWFNFSLCNEFSPLPCWLVGESQVHICTNTLNKEPGHGFSLEESVKNKPIDMRKRLTDYFQKLAEHSEEYSTYSYPDPSSMVDWLAIILKRAMTAVEDSGIEKRKFDSIGYNNRFGFGR